MRRAAKVDANQAEIVAAFESVFCSVMLLSDQGNGIPDMAVGRNNITRLVEVKGKYGKLTPAQKLRFSAWRGSEIAVIRTVEEALNFAEEYL